MSIKVCPSCGSKFACDGDNDCWCEHVPIHKAQMVEILGLYTDCICPDCLNRFRAKD